DLSPANLDAVVEPEVRQEESDHGQDQRDGQQSRERYGPECHEAVEEVERTQAASERDLGADEDKDGARLVVPRPHELAPVLARGGFFGTSDGSSDLLDRAFPPDAGLVAPPENGRASSWCGRSGPAEAAPLDGGPEAHECQAGEEGHPRDEHERED